MREILFRGKCRCTGEWIHGQYIRANPMDYPRDIRKPKAVIFPVDAECNWRTECFYDTREVIQETVGQFTGRVDKCGAKVFEGDILQTYIMRNDGEIRMEGTCVVLFDEHDQAYVVRNTNDVNGDWCYFGSLGEGEYYQIIGNIHDNPELLKGET